MHVGAIQAWGLALLLIRLSVGNRELARARQTEQTKNIKRLKKLTSAPETRSKITGTHAASWLPPSDPVEKDSSSGGSNNPLKVVFALHRDPCPLECNCLALLEVLGPSTAPNGKPTCEG